MEFQINGNAIKNVGKLWRITNDTELYHSQRIIAPFIKFVARLIFFFFPPAFGWIEFKVIYFNLW